MSSCRATNAKPEAEPKTPVAGQCMKCGNCPTGCDRCNEPAQAEAEPRCPKCGTAGLCGCDEEAEPKQAESEWSGVKRGLDAERRAQGERELFPESEGQRCGTCGSAGVVDLCHGCNKPRPCGCAEAQRVSTTRELCPDCSGSGKAKAAPEKRDGKKTWPGTPFAAKAPQESTPAPAQAGSDPSPVGSPGGEANGGPGANPAAGVVKCGQCKRDGVRLLHVCEVCGDTKDQAATERLEALESVAKAAASFARDVETDFMVNGLWVDDEPWGQLRRRHKEVRAALDALGAEVER